MTDELRDHGLLDETDLAGLCRRGHFVYESGDHGDVRLALGLLFADPHRLRDAAGRLAERLRPYAPEVVCGPLVGGALVGQWIAYDLSSSFVYAELLPTTASAGSRYAVPRELEVALVGKRAVVVDDAINAGAATLGSVRAIQEAGGSVVAAALLVRTPIERDAWGARGLGLEYLAGVPWHTWSASACPLCAAGTPLESSVAGVRGRDGPTEPSTWTHRGMRPP